MDDAGTERMLRSAVAATGRAWLELIASLRAATPVDQLHAPFTSTAAAAGQFAAALHHVYLGAAQQEARWLGAELDREPSPIAKKLISFDTLDPAAQTWAEQNRLDLIREITAEQRALIHAVILDAQRTGINPRDAAALLRDSIGLTEYQLDRVAAYRRALEAGDLSRALAAELGDGRYDRALRAAIDSGDVIPIKRIDAMVARYRVNWIRYRAETIARTQGLRAAHQGSEALFAQSVARGTLTAQQIQRKWLHYDRPGERPGHKKMHGQTRGMGEAFETPSGEELRYPCDPDAPAAETIGCTCAVATRIRSAVALAA